MATPVTHRSRTVPIGDISLHVREWDGTREPPFLLVHGLSSNSLTWSAVARRLNERGHYVAAVDQRGHGLSDKPDNGYDFEHVTADLKALIAALGLQRPILAGQSWGGNVVLEFAARYPDVARGLVLVDGGFLGLSAQPGITWEQIERDLKPPVIQNRTEEQVREFMRNWHPDWSEEGLEGTFANLEVQPDGAVRARLTLDRHMAILRSLWEQKPSQLYPRVKAPVLIAAARDGDSLPDDDNKVRWVQAAEAGLEKVRVRWFDETAHDIHVHRPDELADWILQALEEGFFGD